MKKIIIYFTYIFILFVNFSIVAAIEEGKWVFVKDTNYCYIGSSPEKSELPEGKKRGDTYILVYRINNSNDAVIQFEAGYPLKKNNDVVFNIDNSQFNFFSEDETAWTNEDQKVIFSMKKGNVLIVKGESSKGTKTKDVYTLKGFTAAFNKLFNDC